MCRQYVVPDDLCTTVCGSMIMMCNVFQNLLFPGCGSPCRCHERFCFQETGNGASRGSGLQQALTKLEALKGVCSGYPQLPEHSMCPPEITHHQQGVGSLTGNSGALPRHRDQSPHPKITSKVLDARPGPAHHTQTRLRNSSNAVDCLSHT